ncbi:hypothetical protein D081_2069 [Anaerovibrio sp. JC8]|nr:hypothetical protein D081_2069 [Anaerovibrio sp. JC8]
MTKTEEEKEAKPKTTRARKTAAAKKEEEKPKTTRGRKKAEQ